jgi:hypothetical protein
VVSRGWLLRVIEKKADDLAQLILELVNLPNRMVNRRRTLALLKK